MNKAALRQKLRDVRQKLTAEEVARASLAAAELFLKNPLWASARTVALHLAVRGELPTTPLLMAAWEAGKRVALPRMENGRMVMRLVTSTTPLTPGAFNIQEPPATATEISPGELDLILTPGLAFDRTGGRLGQGGGDYDRLLSAVGPNCAKVGWCHDFQVIECVPVEPHDQRVDLIATPKDCRTVIR
jgi:5-formyltetrahydrofolate cyclo-ligase